MKNKKPRSKDRCLTKLCKWIAQQVLSQKFVISNSFPKFCSRIGSFGFEEWDEEVCTIFLLNFEKSEFSLFLGGMTLESFARRELWEKIAFLELFPFGLLVRLGVNENFLFAGGFLRLSFKEIFKLLYSSWTAFVNKFSVPDEELKFY